MHKTQPREQLVRAIDAYVRLQRGELPLSRELVYLDRGPAPDEPTRNTPAARTPLGDVAALLLMCAALLALYVGLVALALAVRCCVGGGP